MRRTDPRLIRGAILIALPALLLFGAAAFVCADTLPRAARRERALVTRHYRQMAERIERRAETDDFTAPRRPKGFRRARGRLASGCAWGVAQGTIAASPLPKGRCLVWIERPEGGVRGRVVESLEIPDLTRPFVFLLALAALAILALTLFSIRIFIGSVRAREDFMAAAAHDLMTPLLGLRGVIGVDDREAANLNERLIRIVRNITDFLRLGARVPAPAREPVDLLAAFDAAYRTFRADYRDLFDGQDLEVRGKARQILVRADEDRLVQVLWNLLGNDLKYAAPYGRVWAEFAVRDGMGVLELIDEGPGMTPAQMRRAFTRYYRARQVLACGKGGFGIGLCAAREMARAMSGDLALRPNSPHGCIFTLSLPLAPR